MMKRLHQKGGKLTDGDELIVKDDDLYQTLVQDSMISDGDDEKESEPCTPKVAVFRKPLGHVNCRTCVAGKGVRVA